LKHKPVQAWKYYSVEGGKLVRKRRQCPRCGRFMAEHENRYSCGGCGYTEFKGKGMISQEAPCGAQMRGP
jgi:small subunit ribosomal protein S27Ae